MPVTVVTQHLQGETQMAGIQVGVHLPANQPDASGADIIEWARRAEQLGFSSIGAAERFTYATYDALTCLAAAAAVTERVRIVSNIFIPALRHPTVWAKEVSTLSHLAGGRLVVGVAPGARSQDYTESGQAWEGRGRRVTDALAALRDLQSPKEYPNSVGPVPARYEVLVGGTSKGALARMVEFGDGYISGGLLPQIFTHEVAAARGAWAAAGREGSPRIVAGTWCSSEARHADATAWLTTYLERGGPPEPIRAPISRGADETRAVVAAFEEAGATEVLLFLGHHDISELEWLADVVGDRLSA